MLRRRFCQVAMLLGLGVIGSAALADLPHRKPVVKADKVVIEKSARQLLLLRNERIVKRYRIALGSSPVGPKRKQGDGRTPEGRYLLDWRNPESSFYRSIHISYPSPRDIAQARETGVSPGGDIMIHGLPEGLDVIGPTHAKWDWTNGCIAVTNAEMDEIWARVDDGTPIEILP